MQPSQVGISIPTIAFQALYQGVDIGTVSASSAVNLRPLSTIALPLSGRLIPQTSQAGLDAVSALVNQFVHGKDSNVAVQGTAASLSGASVSHLTFVSYLDKIFARRLGSRKGSQHSVPKPLFPTMARSMSSNRSI